MRAQVFTLIDVGLQPELKNYLLAGQLNVAVCPNCGTPAMIADQMEDWFTSGACDGFVLPPTVFPVTYEEFGRMVTPELQRRGLLRRDYAGRTLRENLANPG